MSEPEWDMEKIHALPTFDVADHLDSEEMIAAYLAEFENDTPEMQAEAQTTVQRARERLATITSNSQEPK